MRAVIMLAAPITVPAALPTAASADGDPASDYLLYQVFTPFAKGTPALAGD